MKYSLRLLIPMLLLVFAAAVALAVFRSGLRLAQEGVEQRGVSVLTEHMIHFQGNAEYFLRTGNHDRVQQEITYMLSQPAVADVLLFDDLGKLIASSRRADIGRSVHDILTSAMRQRLDLNGREVEQVRQTQAGRVFLTADRQSVVAFYPVLLWDENGSALRPTRTGIAFASYDLMPEKINARREVEKQVSLFAGFALGMAFLLWLLFHFLLARRASRLVNAVRRFANDEFDGSSGVTGRDELGQIGKAFDDMVNRMTESRRRLLMSEKRFNTAFNSNPDMVTISRLRDGVLLDINEAFVRISGYSRDEIIGHTAIELGLWQNPAERETLVEQLRLYGTIRDHEVTMTTRIGATRVVLFSADLIEIESDPCILSVARDITERKHMESQIFEAKERAEVTLSSIGDAVITTDNRGVVEYLNPVAEQLTGWTQKEANGMPLPSVFRIVNELTRTMVDNPVQKCLERGIVVGLANHTVLISRDGTERAIEDSAAPIRDRQGNIIGVVMVFHDVSSARIMARQLSWQASHDALTGLVNRREFENRLSRAMANAQDNQFSCSLMYLDLDMFKVVNDTCGHVAGDELLRQVSVVMQSRLRDADTLARLGGDEFGVLLERCPPDKSLSIANALLKAVQEFRFVWESKTFDVGASIGLVHINSESRSITRLMSVADMTCYAAKEKGRNRVHVFEEGDADIEQRHGEMQWVSRITDALKQNRLRLYRQSIVPVQGENGPVRHCEVLIRMLDEHGEMVLPGAFLPAAERYNLMPAIDRWVIETLLKDMEAAMAGEGIVARQASQFLFNINISGASLSDDSFLEFVRKRLQQSSIRPDRICFEITETAAISNLAKTSHFIRELKATLGCGFALDDFGSGVSSFAYLKNLPVDYLKIDGAFVRDMVDDPINRAMVEAINKIGHTMGIRTIAEFVENEAILAELRRLGVDYAQGYGIDKPRFLQLAEA